MVEEVVGQLIGAEGIDLALIGPLSELSSTATDRLTLETLSGDLAVLDWQEPEAIIRALVSVNVDAERATHPHDPEAPAAVPGKRRVFAFDMSRFEKPADLVAALRDLNQRRGVRTFSIGLEPSGGGSPMSDSRSGSDSTGPGSDPSGDPKAARKASQPSVGMTRQALAAEGPADSGNRSKDPRGEPQSPAPGSLPTDGPASRIDLDDLLDQLDRADP